jgi:hypothetical protein
MTMMRSHEAHGRKLIFLLVFLSHCALIFIISRSNTTQKSATQILHEPLFVFFLNSIKAETGADDKKEPPPAKARTVLRRPNTVAPSNLSKPTDPDVMSSNAITDWYAQAHSVAEDALEKDRNKGAKRAFEHKIPSAQEREKTSIFDPAPARRAGTWDGPDRFYVTDNCYYEYDRLPRPPPTLLDNRLKTPVCKRPPKGGGDAMFKDLTPAYLKTLPELKSP